MERTVRRNRAPRSARDFASRSTHKKLSRPHTVLRAHDRLHGISRGERERECGRRLYIVFFFFSESWITHTHTHTRTIARGVGIVPPKFKSAEEQFARWNRSIKTREKRLFLRFVSCPSPPPLPPLLSYIKNSMK